MEFEDIEVNSQRWFQLDDLLNEEWRDIEDFEGLYQVSNYARVKSLKYKGKENNPQILKNKIDKRGRKHITLLKNTKRKHCNMGTLVGRTFLPNPNKLPVICHINDPFFDRVDNLKWGTCKDVEEIKYKKLEVVPIYIDGKYFNTTASAARYYGIDPALVGSRKQQGWSIEESLKIKPGILKNKCNPYLYEYNGKRYSLKQLSQMSGIHHDTIEYRLKKGWGINEAVEIPASKNGKKVK